MYQLLRLLLVLAMSFLSIAGYSQNALTPGVLRIDATYENISVNYSIFGDVNLNSEMQVGFKPAGSGSYVQAAKSVRAHPNLFIDGASLGMNFHAASVMHLEAGMAYDVIIALTDPDGGSTTTTQVVVTPNFPSPSMQATLYVAPGSGGGSGTISDPYLGLQEAANQAQPGDHFIVSPGNYTPFTLTTSGTAAANISFKSEGLHSAIIDGSNTPGSIVTLGSFSTTIANILIDGFVIQNGYNGIDAQNSQYISVTNNIVRDVGFGYVNRREMGLESDQFIHNNIFTGRTAWPTAGIPGERGVDLRGNNNVVSYNTISNFGDGVSTDGPPYQVSYSMDIHHNDIINIADDHIEVDGAISNSRIYRNRCFNGRAGVSVAPVFGGPAYILRNELFNFENTAIKMNRGTSGIIAVNNTIVNVENAQESPDGWQNTFYRNNVALASRYCFEFFGLVSGSEDDWDYGGYYSTRGGGVGTEWFKWDNIRYADVGQLTASGILESNAIEVAFSDFVNANLPGPFPTVYSTDDRNFMPVAGAPVINSGETVSNMNDPYVTDGMPDRGALEFGADTPQYGANFDSSGCFAFNAPINLMHQDNTPPGQVTLSWDPILQSIGCQIKATRLSPSGLSVTKTFAGSELSSLAVPYGGIGSGTVWQWLVRCACDIGPPIVATPFSAPDVFTVPVLRTEPSLEKLFPNPAHQQLHLQMQASPRERVLVVTDLLGQLVGKQAVAAGETALTIDVAGYQNGLYLIQLDGTPLGSFEVHH